MQVSCVSSHSVQSALAPGLAWEAWRKPALRIPTYAIALYHSASEAVVSSGIVWGWHSARAYGTQALPRLAQRPTSPSIACARTHLALPNPVSLRRQMGATSANNARCCVAAPALCRTPVTDLLRVLVPPHCLVSRATCLAHGYRSPPWQWLSVCPMVGQTHLARGMRAKVLCKTSAATAQWLAFLFGRVKQNSLASYMNRLSLHVWPTCVERDAPTPGD